MTTRLFIILLLCLFSFCSTAQVCGTPNTTVLRNYPQVSDSSTYIITVRLWFPRFGDCNYGGCTIEPVLCKVITSSDPALKGRHLPIFFTEKIIPLASSEIYTVVLQPVNKETISQYEGSWKQDTCIKKVYLARTVSLKLEQEPQFYF